MIYSGQGYDISYSMIFIEFFVENKMSGLYHKNRSLYMDNFYDRVQLSRKLLQKKIMLPEFHRGQTVNIILIKLLLKN